MKYIFLLIFTWILWYFIFYWIFNSSNDFSTQNGTSSWNTQYVPPISALEDQIHRENCLENECFINNVCVKVPIHASCNDEKSWIISSKIWSCKKGYIDQNDTCMCETWSYVCKNNQEEVNVLDWNIKKTEAEIKSFVVDQSNDVSVLNYNSLVDLYNKLLAERNVFMNEKCYCEGWYNFSEVFNK